MNGADTAGEPPRSGSSEALPALAGGLAHDLNNVLSAVLMMVDLLGESCTREREKSVLAALEESARRGVALGRQLLWLARGREEEATVFQPKYLLCDLQRTARAIFPASIGISSQFPSDLGMLQGDPLRLYRLLLDLCLDARDALTAAGGELSLGAWNDALDGVSAAQRSGAVAGPYVVLEVARSTGVGALPPSVAAAAAACGGFAEAVAPADGGQAFRVYLPAVHSPSVPQSTAAAARQGQGELILVVDGDAAVREAVAGILESQGYRVETAADGVEAIALFARDAPAVAAVVLAADLAYLDGPGALRVLRRLREGVAAVLTGEAAAPAAAAEGSAAVVLAKPFSGSALLAAVRQALEPGASAPV
ncbi:MAG TPA: response regulator [Thermoanaerobaculia bacterium]|nr:response regulator [Thermoanaerobaculia bacterium]